MILSGARLSRSALVQGLMGNPSTSQCSPSRSYFLMTGKKTVESRFSQNGCAPYDQVAPGDIVLLKRSGDEIVGLAHVSCVNTSREDETGKKSGRAISSSSVQRKTASGRRSRTPITRRSCGLTASAGCHQSIATNVTDEAGS